MSNNLKISTVVPTKNGNLLIKLTGQSRSGFIYITPEGHYLTAKSEIELGLPINNIEWGALIKNSRQKPAEATSEQIKLALEAMEKRDEFLKLGSMADRMEWANKNRPQTQKTTQTHVQKNNTAVASITKPTTKKKVEEKPVGTTGFGEKLMAALGIK